MLETSGTLLIVDRDHRFAAHLATEAEARGYRPHVADSVIEALQLVDRDVYDAVLVNYAPAAETAFELLDRLKARSLDTELIVMSDGVSLAADIQWFDPEAFTVVRKPDVVQLFGALARGLERRRITAENRRFVWELQTINEITAELTKSLELDDVLTGALARLVSAMDAIGGSIRLRDELTGAYDTLALAGTAALRRLLIGEWPGVPPPSDRVIATHGLVIVDDFSDLNGEGAEPVPLRSAISVPLMVGSELLGILSLASIEPHRFKAADQQLLTTSCTSRSAARSASGSRRSTRSATRSRCSTTRVSCCGAIGRSRPGSRCQSPPSGGWPATRSDSAAPASHAARAP
jgi:DNA-binding response OmpR family regulator